VMDTTCCGVHITSAPCRVIHCASLQGIEAGIHRQAIFTGLRVGCYGQLLDAMTGGQDRDKAHVLQRTAAAAITSAVGITLANPSGASVGDHMGGSINASIQAVAQQDGAPAQVDEVPVKTLATTTQRNTMNTCCATNARTSAEYVIQDPCNMQHLELTFCLANRRQAQNCASREHIGGDTSSQHHICHPDILLSHGAVQRKCSVFSGRQLCARGMSVRASLINRWPFCRCRESPHTGSSQPDVCGRAEPCSTTSKPAASSAANKNIQRWSAYLREQKKVLHKSGESRHAGTVQGPSTRCVQAHHPDRRCHRCATA
jgi:hypothetical protein